MDSEKEGRVKRSLEKHIPLNIIKSLQKVDDTYIQKVREKYHIPPADKREAIWRQQNNVARKTTLSNTNG
jgi:hypothetical protein